MPDELNRSARKRQAIVDAATRIFLERGYQDTSMDEIAAAAAVSKQTVYKNFADKKRLFTDIILGTLDAVAEPFGTEIRALTDAGDLEKALHELAGRYLAAVLQPPVIRLRRLIIGESGRLPELARTYYERAPERTLTRLAECFGELAERGVLAVEDPMLAAEHFAFLILGRPLDRALFHGQEQPLAPADVVRLTAPGVRVFLAAYGKH